MLACLLTQTVFLIIQIVVLGLTPSLSAVECLEKRVRSRFSGRQIFFMNPLLPEEVRISSFGKNSLAVW